MFRRLAFIFRPLRFIVSVLFLSQRRCPARRYALMPRWRAARSQPARIASA
jgi:hypothetical protein